MDPSKTIEGNDTSHRTPSTLSTLFKLSFGAALFMSLVPIWGTTWLPLQDLGGHIELFDAVYRFTDPTSLYGSTYLPPRLLDPNSLSLAIAWLLGPLLGTMAVTKLLLTFYVLGLPLSMLAISRAFDRSPWLALASVPLVFNALLNVGFINYLLALPLMLCMIPWAKNLAEKGGLKEAVILGVGALALFYAHVIAFLIGWAMGAFILLLYGSPSRWRNGLFATLPSLILLLIWMDRMFFDPVATEMGRTFGTDNGLGVVFVSLEQRIINFHTWGTNFFRDGLDEAVLALVGIVWLGAMLSPSGKTSAVVTSWRARCRRYGLELVTLICCVAYVSLPSAANEIAILTERIPIMILLFVLLWPRSFMTSRTVQWLLVPLVGGVLAYPLLVQARFSEFERNEIGELPSVIASMKAGSTMAYVLHNPKSEVTFMKPLWHIPKALHAIENGGVSHDSFAMRPYTPIQYREGQSPTRVAPRFEKSASVYEYDYLLMQSPKVPAQVLGRPGIELIRHEDPWWLFSIDDPDKGLTVVTGPGRGGFQDRFNCPKGTVLSGLSGEHLDVVGNIVPLCRLTKRSFKGTTDIGKPRHEVSRLTRGPFIGRAMRDGFPWESVCAKGEAIAGFRGQAKGLVRGFEVICRPIHPSKGHDYALQAVPLDAPTNFEVLCPQGTVGVGFRGRSGMFIDQIGLLCEVI